MCLITVNNFNFEERSIRASTHSQQWSLFAVHSITSKFQICENKARLVSRCAHKRRKNIEKKPRLMSLCWNRPPLSANTAAMISYPPFSLSLSFLALFRLTHIQRQNYPTFERFSMDISLIFLGSPGTSKSGRNLKDKECRAFSGARDNLVQGLKMRAHAVHRFALFLKRNANISWLSHELWNKRT